MLPKGEAPGLAVALGGVGVKLPICDALRGHRAARHRAAAQRESRRRGAAAPAADDPAAAWYVGNVLLGAPPPENAVGGRIAYKTGTSYGYRDAWAIGFDGKHTIGVWVGRPDGAPVPGLVGRIAAAPILFDAFARARHADRRRCRCAQGRADAANAKLPPPLQRFRPGRLAGATAQPPLHIMFPPDGARLELVDADGKPDPVPLKITGGVAPLTVLVNGVPVAAATPATLFFKPDGPGFLRVTVMDARAPATASWCGWTTTRRSAARAARRRTAIAKCGIRQLAASVRRSFPAGAFLLWSARISTRHEA